MKYLSIFFATIVLLSSCTKENNTTSDEYTPIFTQSKIDDIGRMHNEIILGAASNGKGDLDLSKLDTEEKIILAHIDNRPQILKDSKTIQEAHQVVSYLDNQVDIFNTLENSHTKELFSSLLKASLVSNINSYSEFLTYLSERESYIKNNVLGRDKEFLLIATSVAKNSAYLWLPIEKGGLGLTFQSSANLRGQDCGEAALVADIAAAGGYFLSIGFGLTIPGANAVIAGSIALASSVASSIAYANCVQNGGDGGDGDCPKCPIEMDGGN